MSANDYLGIFFGLIALYAYFRFLRWLAAEDDPPPATDTFAADHPRERLGLLSEHRAEREARVARAMQRHELANEKAAAALERPAA